MVKKKEITNVEKMTIKSMGNKIKLALKDGKQE